MSIERIRRQSGLTLIELILFIVIVGIAVSGVLGVMTLTTRNSADPQLRKQAIAIAESLMEEVQLARMTYCDPADANAMEANGAAGCASLPETVGREAGNTRPYDNVNDYVAAFGANTSFTPADSTGVITDAAGNAIVTTGAYRAFVRVDADANLNGIAGSGTADTDLLKVTVTVTYGNNESVVLESYRTRYAPNAIP